MGSGPSDAEEIKAHPFFRGVSWDAVYNKYSYVYVRRLPVEAPSFEIEEFATPVDSSALFHDESGGLVYGDIAGGNIPGWSFAKK